MTHPVYREMYDAGITSLIALEKRRENMSGNNMINEEEIRILNTWWQKMKAWHLPEDLFDGASPVAMRPVRFLLSDEDGVGDDALMMYEIIRADRKQLCLFLDMQKWSRYVSRDKQERIGSSYWGSESYFIDDDAASVDETFAKLIPCFKEETILRSDWDGPHFMLEFWSRFELDRASFQFYLKDESIVRLAEDPFLAVLLGEILSAWEEESAEDIVEKECYTKYWKPRMSKMLKVYRKEQIIGNLDITVTHPVYHEMYDADITSLIASE